LGPGLQAGDTFQLFNQPVSGFANISLPSVAPNVWTNTLAVNGTVQVVVPIATNPTNISVLLVGDHLTLTWPDDHLGWTLQAQTNNPGAGIGTNWVNMAGSTTTNLMNIPINPANGSVFFRLIYP